MESAEVEPQQIKTGIPPYLLIIIGFISGAVLVGGGIFVWQQKVLSDSAKKYQDEYIALYDEYQHYQPPVVITQAPTATGSALIAAKEVSHRFKDFNQNDFAVRSPLLEGKRVEETTYLYEGKTITAKYVTVDDYTGIAEWEYDSPTTTNEIPSDFVTIIGYENYGMYGTPVSDQLRGTETYVTKSGMTLYYRYENAPKSIGSVQLVMYRKPTENSLQKPLVIYLWYSKLLASSKTDPQVLAAKLEVQKVAETISF